MSRPLTVSTVIMIFAGFFALYSVLGTSSNRNETDSLQGDIDEIRFDLDALQWDIEEVQSTLESLEWRIE